VATAPEQRRSGDSSTFPYWLQDEVVALRWPQQRAEVERFAMLSVPRLLFVEPGAPPPPTRDCLEDWVRMPADDQDVRVRLAALAHRAREHPQIPTLDGHGQLSYRGRRVFLSPTDERIAAALVADYDCAVSEEDLFRRVWPDGGRHAKLRVHVSRLRKRIEPLGLDITSIRHFGYRLHGRFPGARRQDSVT
jgi:Transcriptional regulatory protein, C terminal